MSNLFNEPVSHTCPTIDSVIKTIESVSKELEHHEDENVRNLAYDLFSLIYKNSPMEEIREANLTLRNWGNDLLSYVNVVEEDLIRANSRIQQLEETLDGISFEL
jgi:hypothetical protein